MLSSTRWPALDAAGLMFNIYLCLIKITLATGRIDLQQLSDSITDDTCLVSIMLANNEIGVLQDIAEINEICRTAGVPLHTDATQAVGRIPIDVKQLGVDLLSFSSHKFYGPKGIGGLYIRKSRPSIRLEPLMLGGGQKGVFVAGTLNPPGNRRMAALKYCYEGLDEENERLRTLRDRLYHGLLNNIDQVLLNGPRLNTTQLRLTNNLNVSFTNVDGESLMMSMRIWLSPVGVPAVRLTRNQVMYFVQLAAMMI